ncbi:MAG: T9SS C-terminal target domain-containing protein, partial [Chitinophagia bacterium]|nr:T9SS C-terminal target domain-containing protein [Chitinophagia bacterium]
NITTIAGSGTSGYTGDGGPATASKLNQPTGINYGYGGNIIVADFGNNVVRVIDWAGNILTVAGSGGFGFAGDGGPATAATFRRPYAVCSDGLGNVYIADEGNSTIRKVAQPLTLSVPAQAPTQQSLRAYPNPSNGHLTLQLPHGWQNVYITITDCAGRTISSQHTNPSPETIPMDLPDGLYLLSVVNETGAREYARIVVTGSLNH